MLRQKRGMVQLCDTLDASNGVRICRDGSLVAEVFAARTGLQDYLGQEVDPENSHGLRDKAIAKVYRPASEVFKFDSLASYAAAPVTIDHPPVAVTADNWRDYGRGEIHGDIVPDGQKVRVPIIVRDAQAVKAATTTHKQISMGYSTELVFPTDGKHPDGTACDAYQTNIRINHIAFVPAARGGPELRIVDERKPLHLLTDGIGDAKAWLKKAIALHKKHMDGTAPTTGPAGEKSQMLMMEQMENALAALDGESPASRMKMDFDPKEPPMKIKIGDAEADATNGEAVRIAVDALNSKLADGATKLTASDAKVAELTTSLSTKDAEIATLKQQVADAAITPAKLRDAAKAYAQVCDKAKSVGVSFAEDADADAIMKAVVDAKMGDAAKDWTADQIAASFAVLTKDAKPDPMVDIFKDGIVNVGDAEAQFLAAQKKLSDARRNAWKNPVTGAAA